MGIGSDPRPAIEVTRQPRRDRLARRIGKVYLGGVPFLAVAFVAGFVGPLWLAVMGMLIGGGLMLCGFVMLVAWYIGAVLPDDWVNEWLD